MDTGKLDVFADGIDFYLAVLGHGVHLDFLGVLDKFADDNGMLFADVGCQTQEALELFGIGAYIHGGA